MAKKDRDDKAEVRDREQEQPPPSDDSGSGDQATGTATLDAGTLTGDAAVRASDQSLPQSTLAATLDAGRPDPTVVDARLDENRDFDPRTAPTPAGADVDTGLASTLAGFGDLGKGVRTSPNRHGIGSTFPGETDLTTGSDRESLLADYDLKGGGDTGSKQAPTPYGGHPKTDGNQGTAGGSDASKGTGGPTDGGSEHMGDLSHLPPGVELNANAPHPEWYEDDNLKGLLPNQFGGGDDKKFKPADAKDFKEKSDKASGSTDAAYKEWLKKTSPDGGTKMSDPDAAGGTGGAVPTVLDGPPPDPGAGISHTVNPQDDPHAADIEGFDPKADPRDPYVLRDPDATDGGGVPTVLDGPPPDPGAGISHPVNPQDDLGGGQLPPVTSGGGGGTQENPQTHVGEATLGDASVEGAPQAVASAVGQDAPQIAAGNDFGSPAVDATGSDDPGAVPPGSLDDDDGP